MRNLHRVPNHAPSCDLLIRRIAINASWDGLRDIVYPAVAEKPYCFVGSQFILSLTMIGESTYPWRDRPWYLDCGSTCLPAPIYLIERNLPKPQRLHNHMRGTFGQEHLSWGILVARSLLEFLHQYLELNSVSHILRTVEGPQELTTR